jgi:hypothetical protein
MAEDITAYLPSYKKRSSRDIKQKKAPVLFGPAQPAERRQLQPRRTKSMRYRVVQWTGAHQGLKPAAPSADLEGVFHAGDESDDENYFGARSR